MAIRTDLTFEWETSPRIITVLAPSTELTIQDLVDTCRFNEMQILNLDDDYLIAAAGKEPLGGGVQVGITATLQNALIAFQARPGPSYVQCTVSGGNLVANDVFGDPVITPIFPTAFTQVVTAASSSATLLTPSQATFEGIAEEVWDLATLGHTNAGSFGEAVTSGGIAPSTIADAVWDAQTSNHQDAGSFGKQQTDIKTTTDEVKTDVDGLVTNNATVLSLVEILIKYSRNRTRVDQTAKTLTVYDDDTLTPIKVFDLKDFTGNPSYTEVAERMPQP